MTVRHLFVIWAFFSSGTGKTFPFMTGPGLRPQETMLPCQYFKVIGVGNKSLDISIEGILDERIIRVRPFVFYDPDNDYALVRYKIHFYLDSLLISVKLQGSGEHIRDSPVSISGGVNPHSCSSPRKNFTEWLEKECEIDPQVPADFEAFPDKLWDMNKLLKLLLSKKDLQSYCHYVIKENEVFRTCYGKYTGFKMFVDKVLLYLTRVVVMPDVEFFINLGDWPIIRKDFYEPIPMLSWCKTDQYSDILLPTYDITESSLECMGQKSVNIFSTSEESLKSPWKSKLPLGFWRGRDSRRERLLLVQLANKYPNYIDAGITNYFFFREWINKLGSVNRTSFFNFFKYKYQITIDGTVAAYRFPYLLSGNSVVLKQDSEYYEHFYKRLQPFKHYVPFKSDLENLIDRIKWARANSESSHLISKEARKFAINELHPMKIFCYHASVLAEYRKRLSDPSTIRPSSSMTKVAYDDEPADCRLRHAKRVKDEF